MSTSLHANAAEEIATLRALIRRTKRQIRDHTIDPIKGNHRILRASAALITLHKTQKRFTERQAIEIAMTHARRHLDKQLKSQPPTPDPHPTTNN